MPHIPNTMPCIMWAAPFCLHDSSSGAAIEVKLMFEQLVKRGIRCHVLSALIFDAESGVAPFDNLDQQLAEQANAKWFELEDNGVTYQYYHTKSRNVEDMTRAEESDFLRMFYTNLEKVRPDAIMLFGGSALEIALMAESKRRGIKVCSCVFNGNYNNYTFPYSDLLLTDSELSAQNYYNSSRINLLPTGIFLDTKRTTVSGPMDPKYITLVNPVPAKGISIVMRLALMAKKKHPNWQFLILESRGTWGQALHTYKQKTEHFTNVSITRHTTDMRLVYQQTKLLLVPSLWYEGFGRVAAEAILNGIPVLASQSGGLPHTVNGGGINVEAPKKCREDFNYFPTAQECKEWFAKLEEMMDEKNYAAWQEKAREASTIHDIEKNTDRLLSYLMPILSTRPSLHPQYFF